MADDDEIKTMDDCKDCVWMMVAVHPLPSGVCVTCFNVLQ